MSTSLGLGEKDTETKQTVSCSRGKDCNPQKSRVDGGHKEPMGVISAPGDGK